MSDGELPGDSRSSKRNVMSSSDEDEQDVVTGTRVFNLLPSPAVSHVLLTRHFQPTTILYSCATIR